MIMYYPLFYDSEKDDIISEFMKEFSNSHKKHIKDNKQDIH